MSFKPPTEFDAWTRGLTVEAVRRQMLHRGCNLVLVKVLGRNNNSKQQIWLGNHLNDLAALPFGDSEARPGSSLKKGHTGAIFHSALNFSWLGPSGSCHAPGTKLVYHPQYPEVRLSGFLQGCPEAPKHLMRIEERGKEAGRLLLIGINPEDRSVFGLVVGADVPLAAAFREMHLERRGILEFWPLDAPVSKDPTDLLLSELCGISRRMWIPGQRLKRTGLVPYTARNGGGYTLEALLGIVSNAESAPDRHGHEIKQFGVGRLDRPTVAQVTLFDTVPDQGAIRDLGAADFMRKHGYHSPGKARFDFTGRHRLGQTVDKTHTRLELVGYDDQTMESTGMVALFGPDEELLMGWSFAKMIEHWGRKHALAAYVPSENRASVTEGRSSTEYRYGQDVHIGIGTNFNFFLKGLQDRVIMYDPGMHAPELGAPGSNKIRHLFRVRNRDLPKLYEAFLNVDACSDASTRQLNRIPTLTA